MFQIAVSILEVALLLVDSPGLGFYSCGYVLLHSHERALLSHLFGAVWVGSNHDFLPPTRGRVGFVFWA
jgi:hypothetical protein